MSARMVSAAVCLILPWRLLAAEAQWYVDQEFTSSETSTVACDVIRSPFTKMIGGGLRLVGHPATGRLYATLPAKDVRSIRPDPKRVGTRVVESHTLTANESKALSRLFSEAGDHGVPFWLQVAVGIPPVPFMIGQGFTVMDYLLRQYPANSVHPKALAEIVKSGGVVARLITIQDDAQHHPWIGQHIVLQTTINRQPKSYLLCSAHFALKIE